MAKKTLYFDTETTGVDPAKYGLIQLACLVDIDGEVIDEANWQIKPFRGDLISKEASEVTGYSREDMEGFPDPEPTYQKICTFFGKHIDKFDRTDKFWPAGYNCRFDLDFLNAFFKKNGDDYFGSWQNWNAIDGLALVRFLAWRGDIPMLENFKLGTACNHFNIPLGDQAHDAIADIRATRKLILELQGVKP